VSVPSEPGSTRLAGIELHALDEDQVISHVLDALLRGEGGWLVNPNIDVLRQVDRDPELRALVGRASLVVADGAPVEWAARLAGRPLPPRVPGSRLIWSLSAAAAAAGCSVFLLGGAPGVADRAAVELVARAPGLKVAGTHCPPFGFETDPAAGAAVSSALVEAYPDIVFCGLGFPKQERLMDRLAGEFPRSWFIGSGASITFAAGDVARAPAWMQRAGFEWVFRLVTEPRRLARRYLVDDLPYAVRLLTRAALEGRRQRAGADRVEDSLD
jgi:N-acetylglucosaminyldiphosphoundecaprenol N-acetyl-beta-D-mannosaminyltransferase